MGLHVDKVAIVEFCRKNGIRKLAIFGSALRADFGPESDLDVLVEFQPGVHAGLLRLAHLEEELSQLLGHKVDLNTPGSLSPYFREEVLREARVVHEQA